MNVQHRISLRSTSYAGQAIQHPIMNERHGRGQEKLCLCYFFPRV